MLYGPNAVVTASCEFIEFVLLYPASLQCKSHINVLYVIYYMYDLQHCLNLFLKADISNISFRLQLFRINGVHF